MENQRKEDILPFPSYKTRTDRELMEEAYFWADSKRRKGEPSSPLRIEFDSDYINFDNGCHISLFVSEGKAIMRREWAEDHSVLYNSIVNYEEIIKVAPKSVERMIQNGLEIYKVKGEGYRAFFLLNQRKKH